MFTTNSPINIVADLGLALGAVFSMAGTFVVQPNLQAVFWAIDGAGLVMAAAILALKYFRTGEDLVAAGFMVFAIAEGSWRFLDHCELPAQWLKRYAELGFLGINLPEAPDCLEGQLHQ